MIRSTAVSLCMLLLASPGCRQTPAADGAMTGMFIYMADAAMFTECGTGRRLPVAQEGGYLELERAYSQQRSTPGAPLFATVQGGVENRPQMEGVGTVPSLVVKKFISVEKGRECSELLSELRGKWLLVSLSADKVLLNPPAYLEFVEAGLRVNGFSGCNRFAGTYVRQGADLHFGALAGTKMACPDETMRTESRFLNALAAVTSYRVVGSQLELLGSERQLMARLARE